MKHVLIHIAYFLARLASRLPLRVLYFISDVLRPFFRGYRRKIVKQNLKNSFPEKSEKELLTLERGYYHFLCDYVVESLKLLTVSREEMKRRMTMSGLEEVRKSLETHDLVFIYLGHYCNWEWMSSLPLWTDGIHTAQLYKALHDPVMDLIFTKMRSRFGSENIEKNVAYRRIMQMKRDGEKCIIGTLADQSPKWENIHDWIDFLHQDTPIFTGTERIAKKVNAAVFYGEFSRLKRGYYKCHMRRMTDDVSSFEEYKLSECYMQLLEETIKSEPRYWLWSHKRWKHVRQRTQYAEAVQTNEENAHQDIEKAP